jgi:GNAT superfamily N-acetyltransferase
VKTSASRPPVTHGAFRAAEPGDGPVLSALAIRSKGLWGYSGEFLEACRDELTFDAAYIRRHTVFVLENDGRVAGFYTLERQGSGDMELGGLFVNPGDTRRGYGSALMEHAKRQAAILGATRILIHGDPHAEKFYIAMGARSVGEVPSASIPGRTLPLFHVYLGGDSQ